MVFFMLNLNAIANYPSSFKPFSRFKNFKKCKFSQFAILNSFKIKLIFFQILNQVINIIMNKYINNNSISLKKKG